MALRYIIVNADDFGLSDGVNRGIAETHEGGIVTSASLMTRGKAATAAARYARAHPSLGVGLHVDFGEWAYRNGEWVAVSAITPAGDAAAVEREVEAQLQSFRTLMSREPTHLDSHQHAHLGQPVREVLIRHARVLGIPLRKISPGIRYEGGFYGQTHDGFALPGAIAVDRLIALLNGCPPGVTELGCHPGYRDDLDSMYCVEREAENAALCDPRARASIAASGIILRSFANLADVWRGWDG